MTRAEVEGSAWYHHFWPWFIVCLLGVSVVASLYTVSIAYRLGDLESADPPPSIDASAMQSDANRTTQTRAH